MPASDLWSNEEHQQQDGVIKRRLVGKDGKPRKYDVNVETLMAVVLKFVRCFGGHTCFMSHPQSTITLRPLKKTQIF